MELGRTILPDDKLEAWDKTVITRIYGIWQGSDLGWALEIINLLNNKKTFEDAKNKLLMQGHFGMSTRAVCTLIQEFCLRGNDFVEYAFK